MKLTGNCKDEFEKWYRKNNTHSRWVQFEIAGNSMKFGVYVDFFDSVGILINISPLNFPLDNNFWSSVNGKVKYHKTRPEARTAAIEKANEIHNK